MRLTESVTDVSGQTKEEMTHRVKAEMETAFTISRFCVVKLTKLARFMISSASVAHTTTKY